MSSARRRLAAIMFTDMVGYTALGQKNESLSLALVDEQRKLIRPILAKHEGREVKTMGDGFLVEFSGALNAVRCAYDIQRTTREFNISQPQERRIHLRIGVHLGDVVESQDDISGDAVNLASRIEPLAEDGGVCLTRQVYDQIYNKFELPLLRIGKKALKNVSVPVDVYKVVFPWEEQTPRKSTPRTLDRKRVAILPLLSLSPNPEDEYFADGTTEEMISTLSNVSELTVISRTSVMQYKGAKKNLAEIGKELKAGTMLEGSVRKVGNRVRITVQLLDAVEDKHLWSQSYDRELQDVFAVQSDIAKSVAESLRVKLLAKDTDQIQKKPTKNMDAYIHYLNGRQSWNKRTEKDVQKGVEYFTQAIDIDPNFALAYVGLADCYQVLYDKDVMNPAEANEKARQAVMKALKLDDTLAEAYSTYAMVLANDWNWDAAEARFKKAIGLNQNYATAHHWYSILLRIEGRLEQALVEARKGLELDPLAPVMSFNVSTVLYALRRYDDAIEYLERSLAIDPNFPYALFGLMVANAWKKDFDKAKIWWQKFYSRDNRDPSSARSLVDLATIQALQGNQDEAHRQLDSAMKAQDARKIHALDYAVFYSALHEENKALEYLEVSVKEHDPNVTNIIKWEPIFENLHSNPRFSALLQRIGIDKY